LVTRRMKAADEVGGDCCGDDAEQADTGTDQEDCGNPASEGHRVPVPIPDGGDSRHGPPQRVAVGTDVGAGGVLLELEDGNAAGERQRGSQDTDIGNGPCLQGSPAPVGSTG
jgi:hypothetical protein